MCALYSTFVSFTVLNEDDRCHLHQADPQFLYIISGAALVGSAISFYTAFAARTKRFHEPLPPVSIRAEGQPINYYTV